MNFNIVTDEKILKAPCSDVTPEEVPFLTERLQSELEEYNLSNPKNPGVGLAAPQIGINKRACYIHHPSLELFLINPKIVDGYDFNQIREGCLSIPNRQISVNRYNHVLVESYNYSEGFILSGIHAIIVQHEIDHLNGILITDHLQTRANANKVSRNSPCPCGSGKKFKRCCIV